MTDLAIQPGEGITTFEQIEALPVGSVIAESHNERATYTRVGENVWRSNLDGDTLYDDSFSLSGYNVVVSVPEDWTPPPPPTLHQFKWRFRDNALDGMHAHGVRTEVVMEGLRALDVADAAQFPPGVGLVIENPVDRDSLPEGTVILVGTPDVLDSFGVYLRQGHGWTKLVGERRYIGDHGPVRVALVGGEEVHQDWIDAIGEGTAEVDNFKAQAWLVCSKIARAQSWCSTFNSIMNRVGVNETCLDHMTHAGHAVGDEVNPEEAARLPVGTVLRRVREDGQTWYIRTADATNRARTRRVMAWGEGAHGHFSPRMTVVAFPHGRRMLCHIPTEAFPHLPAGTKFTVVGNGTDWMTARDGRAVQYSRRMAVPARGTYQPSDFGDGAQFAVIEWGDVS